MSNPNNFDPADFDNLAAEEMRASIGAMVGMIRTVYSESVAAEFTPDQAMHVAMEWMKATILGGAS